MGHENCAADNCVDLTGNYQVSGNCSNLPASPGSVSLTQDGCSLTISGSLEQISGAAACVTEQIFYSKKSCSGRASGSPGMRALFLSCPESDHSLCTLLLQEQ